MQQGNFLVFQFLMLTSSVRSHYRIPNHVKPAFQYRSTSVETIRALSSQAMDFCTLGKAQSLEKRSDEDTVPPGWCVKVVSENLSLLLDLNGVIDCKEEIKRLEREVERLTPQVESYRKKINVPGYEDKVPENVRLLNQEKLSSYESELRTTLEALEGLRGSASA
jgi:valyl-tRNA synthetase